jgi:hypothetical protein
MAADIVGVDVLLQQARELFRDTFGVEATLAAVAPGRQAFLSSKHPDNQCCGAGAGAGAARSRLFWSEPEPEP